MTSGKPYNQIKQTPPFLMTVLSQSNKSDMPDGGEKARAQDLRSPKFCPIQESRDDGPTLQTVYYTQGEVQEPSTPVQLLHTSGTGIGEG